MKSREPQSPTPPIAKMPTIGRLQAAVEVVTKLAEVQSAKSIEGYLHHVVINCSPEPRPFREVGELWQWERFHRLAPAVEAIASLRQDYKGPLNFVEIWPRGHDKTSSIARVCNWLLCYSRKPLSILAAAADTDQAAILGDAMETEARLNPWLSNQLKFLQRKVKGPGGTLHILSADAPTAFGFTPDLILLDEWTHWKKQDLWTPLMSAMAKRKQCVVIIISNAGVIHSWQHDTLKKMQGDAGWSTYHSPGTVATWMDSSVVNRMRRLLPPGEARRVIDNEWIDPAEESGYLTRQEVLCCEQSGVEMSLFRRMRGDAGVRYVASIDYGPKKDRTVLCVGHQDYRHRIIVDKMDVWQGSSESKIQINAVEDWIREANKDFNNPVLVLDPYQMEGTAQRFELHQQVERFEYRGGKKNYEMAECLRSLVVNQMIAWYPGAGTIYTSEGADTLVDELCSLLLKPMIYGYRFDHEANKHDDRAVAIGMMALYAQQEIPTSYIDVTKAIISRPSAEVISRRREEAIKRRRVCGIS